MVHIMLGPAEKKVLSEAEAHARQDMVATERREPSVGVGAVNAISTPRLHNQKLKVVKNM
jgi:hypothetical protein